MESNERRYRAIRYPTSIPRSTSIADTRANYFTALSTHNHDNTYDRRRTADTSPQPGSDDSIPTVIRSGLTTSATTNDISNLAPRLSQPQLPSTRRFTPTRIPSPVWSNKTPTVRHVSTPVLPSQKTQKENVQLKTNQSLVSTPNRAATFIPRSRTMGMLSSLTTSLSRSNLNVNDSREASGSSLHPADVTASDPHYIPLPTYTPNMHQIHASKMNSYWCGRFQALCDRFNDEHLERLQQYDVDYPSPPSTPTSISRERDEYALKAAKEQEYHNFSQNTSTAVDENVDQNESSSRAFLHLQSLCTTNEARRSLWEFQLQFARIHRKPQLLPRGGKMLDDRGSWLGRVGRAGRAMVGGSNTGFGPRTSMGLGKKKTSMISFLNP